jgi:putative peptide zinc metalloprotease protein
MPGATFSDAWYRIAEARVALLPAVKVQSHRYRGRLWFVLEDPYSQKFFRITPEAYDFVRALDGERTIDEVWRDYAETRGAAAPGQDEVVRLLSQLHMSNMLFFRGKAHSDAIFERTRAQKQRELYGKLLSFLYVRVRLFDPNKLLDRIRPLILWCTGRTALVVWLAVIVAGGVNVIEHADELQQHTQGLLALDNLGWLYVAMTLLKVFHETAHAFVCKRYGGQVHTFGVMFLIFTPLPYVDATSAWGFASKWRRAYVGLAGVVTELFFAAIGAIVWAHTSEGVINSLAFNVMFIGSVSALLFNGNPLLRFDAYYVLADLIEIPNLYQKGQAQVVYLCDRYLLGNKTNVSPATDHTERVWFTSYGWASLVYRLILSVTILMTVLDAWFAIGVALMVTTLITLIVMPGRKLVMYLMSPALAHRRSRAVGALAALVFAVYAFVMWVPLPHAVRLPGVLEARQRAVMYVETAGALTQLRVQHGQTLRKGDVIAVLRNDDLELNLALTRLQIAEYETLLRQALQKTPADVAPLERRAQALAERMAEFEAMKSRLVVRAPQNGEWVAPVLHERMNSWIERGQPLGEVVDLSSFRFSAVLAQAEAADLFPAADGSGELRLVGQASASIPIARFDLIPYQRDRLASPALGFLGGGDVAVRPDDTSGTLATESFFEVRAGVPTPSLATITAYQGMSGVLRLTLDDQPLYERVRKSFLQLLQRRYAL